MRRIAGSILVFFAWAALLQTSRADQIDFEKQIRPLLLARCGKCHGSQEQNGGLRLDARHTALKGGDSGFGKEDKSK